MNENRTLAVDIGGTFIKYGLIDPDYRVSRHHKVPTLACSSAGEFFDYLCENIPAGANIERIGISCPGLIDRNNVVRSYAAPRLHSLYGANLYEEMKKRTGIGAQAINDAKAAGLCELKLGNARGEQAVGMPDHRYRRRRVYLPGRQRVLGSGRICRRVSFHGLSGRTDWGDLEDREGNRHLWADQPL